MFTESLVSAPIMLKRCPPIEYVGVGVAELRRGCSAEAASRHVSHADDAEASTQRKKDNHGHYSRVFRSR